MFCNYSCFDCNLVLDYEKTHICCDIIRYLNEKRMSFKEMAKRTGISIEKFNLCKDCECVFTIEELCKITFVFDISLGGLVNSI
ncbi:helix-turn-helix domain-containing protein [Pseudomonadota bacterium]